jgi:hypothetical protein
MADLESNDLLLLELASSSDVEGLKSFLEETAPSSFNIDTRDEVRISMIVDRPTPCQTIHFHFRTASLLCFTDVQMEMLMFAVCLLITEQMSICVLR